MRPPLKVCGLMRPEDAALCCALGVEVCGFVTEYPVPVPWNLERSQTAELLRHVLPGTRSCIVTGGSEEKIFGLALELRPDYVQLHGGETLAVTKALVGKLAPYGIEIIKTIPSSPLARLREFGTENPADCAAALSDAGVFGILVDARGPENAAHSDLHADPALFRAVQSKARCRTILGGGIRPQNCAALIAELHPDIIDVMSGVENSPGVKSEPLLKELLSAMEQAQQNIAPLN